MLVKCLIGKLLIFRKLSESFLKGPLLAVDLDPYLLEPPESLKIRLSNSVAALEDASAPSEKVSAAREVCRARLAKSDWNRTNNFLSSSKAELEKSNSSQKAVSVSKLKCGGIFSEDRKQWATEVSGFYSKLYKDDSMLPAGVDLERRKHFSNFNRTAWLKLRIPKVGLHKRLWKFPFWLVLPALAQSTSKGGEYSGSRWHRLGFYCKYACCGSGFLAKNFSTQT